MSRELTAQGYEEIVASGHPLDWANGLNVKHRVVLYDSIGPGPHPCHWCGVLVYWEGPRGKTKLNVDHLDDNRANNDPANLVPSCMDCNIRRGKKPGRKLGSEHPGTLWTHCKAGHALTEDNLYWVSGRRHCKTCMRRYQREATLRRKALQTLAP